MASSLKTACIPYSIIDSFADLLPKKQLLSRTREKNSRGQLEEALSGIGLMSTFRSTTIYIYIYISILLLNVLLFLLLVWMFCHCEYCGG